MTSEQRNFKRFGVL